MSFKTHVTEVTIERGKYTQFYFRFIIVNPINIFQYINCWFWSDVACSGEHLLM